MKRASLALIVCFLPLFATGCEKKEETSYSIVGEYDPETHVFAGTLDFTMTNRTGDVLPDLRFQLYGNAYREGAVYQPLSLAYRSAYYDKLDYGATTIVSVSEDYVVGGTDENLLIVDVPDLAEGKSTRVKIEFETKLAKVNHRLGVGQHCVNLANFYPILCVYDGGWQECIYYNVGDPFYSDCASYDVELTLPASYTVAASANLVSERKTGEKKTCRYQADRLRDFAFVLGEGLSVLTEQVDGATLSYYYGEDEKAKEHFKLYKDSFSYFSDTFGTCMYDSLSLVQTDFPFAGMEYGGLMMVSNALAEETLTYAIVHETAHEWWYEGVGNDQRNHAWMDEGLAEYSCVLFFENHDYGFTREGVMTTSKKAIRSYVGIYAQLFGKTDTSASRNLSTFMSEYEYANLIYNQGIVLFDGLRESIGDKRFLSGLSSYYASFVGKIAREEDLISSFRQTGVDVDGYFNSFLQGKVVI